MTDNYELRISACRPVNLRRLRDLGLPTERLPEITDLYHKGKCENCDDEVWVGPRQAAVQELSDVRVYTLCFACAFVLQNMPGFSTDIVHLGGGAGVEGNVIEQPTEEEIPFAKIDSRDFPLTVELFREDTGEKLWSEVVTDPGVLRIPGFGGHGYLVGVRLLTGRGETITYLGSELADESSN